jgi:hypothetical protein
MIVADGVVEEKDDVRTWIDDLHWFCSNTILYIGQTKTSKIAGIQLVNNIDNNNNNNNNNHSTRHTS